jgi:hypothetical protein
MPTRLPTSAAHVLWTVAVMAVANITIRTWAANHSDSALAQALSFAF